MTSSSILSLLWWRSSISVLYQDSEFGLNLSHVWRFGAFFLPPRRNLLPIPCWTLGLFRKRPFYSLGSNKKVLARAHLPLFSLQKKNGQKSALFFSRQVGKFGELIGKKNNGLKHSSETFQRINGKYHSLRGLFYEVRIQAVDEFFSGYAPFP